jgi:hypothetical protein
MSEEKKYGKKRKASKSAKRRKRDVPAVLHSSHVEVKWVDSATGVTAALNTTGTIALLNGLVLGTGPTNRLGRKIRMKSVQIRAYVTRLNPGASPHTEGTLSLTSSLPSSTSLLRGVPSSDARLRPAS